MNDNEWELFKKQVKPIKDSGKANTFLNKSPNVTLNFQKDEFEIKQSQEIKKISGKNLEKNTLKRIKKGKIKIESILDLHGKTWEESQKKVTKFIEESFENQIRLVLIITGKGYRSSVDFGWKGTGKLKENVPKLLNSELFSRKILWFDKAPPDKGGDGALLVYLKKIKE